MAAAEAAATASTEQRLQQSFDERQAAETAAHTAALAAAQAEIEAAIDVAAEAKEAAAVAKQVAAERCLAQQAAAAAERHEKCVALGHDAQSTVEDVVAAVAQVAACLALGERHRQAAAHGAGQVQELKARLGAARELRDLQECLSQIRRSSPEDRSTDSLAPAAAAAPAPAPAPAAAGLASVDLLSLAATAATAVPAGYCGSVEALRAMAAAHQLEDTSFDRQSYIYMQYGGGFES